MAVSNNTIITSAGLNLATSAHDFGPLIAIKYFLPTYDYRIDPNMYDSLADVMEVSASMSATDVVPYGEVIYNIDESSNSYALAESNNFFVSAGGESLNPIGGGVTVVENSIVSDKDRINLYNDIPLGNYFSGSEVVYNSNDYPDAFKVTNLATVSGSNGVPSEVVSGNSRFFAVSDYYPVSADGVLKGSWKCRLSKNIGNVKFNKIGLYAVKVDNNGNEVGNPILFAESALSAPIIKTNFGVDGFDDIVIDTQLQISSLAVNFSDVFFSTSGDYWSRTVGGLYYGERVGIGNFSDGLEEPIAQLEVKSDSDQFAIARTEDDDIVFDMTATGVAVKVSRDTILDWDFQKKSNLININKIVTQELSGIAPSPSAKNINSVSRVKLNNHFVPSSNGLLDLGFGAGGNNDLAFRALYVNELSNTTDKLNITLKKNLVPSASTIDLGSTTAKYNYVYAKNIAATNIVANSIVVSGINVENELTSTETILDATKVDFGDWAPTVKSCNFYLDKKGSSYRLRFNLFFNSYTDTANAISSTLRVTEEGKRVITLATIDRVYLNSLLAGSNISSLGIVGVGNGASERASYTTESENTFWGTSIYRDLLGDYRLFIHLQDVLSWASTTGERSISKLLGASDGNSYECYLNILPKATVL